MNINNNNITNNFLEKNISIRFWFSFFKHFGEILYIYVIIFMSKSTIMFNLF